jgi:predicted metal-dependent HD superfamily phosphohydrolase
MTALALLRERFERALHEVGAQGDCGPAFERLCAAYAESHRHYHMLEHIQNCLAWLDWSWAKAEHADEVLLAIWYHDAVYNPLAHDNEAKSAAIARRDLASVAVAEEVIVRIEALVMATREHGSVKGDAALLTDIDLSILGAEPPDFERFERDVRSEYASFDAPVYARGRAAVLKKLASRMPMYSTPMLQAELGDQARRNLEAAVERWERHGSTSSAHFDTRSDRDHKPRTATGTLLSVLVPSPSSPYLLLPQQRTLSSARRAQV